MTDLLDPDPHEGCGSERLKKYRKFVRKSALKPE